MNYILGYTCANDVSARDWQIEKQKKQWVRGKSFDTFCPLGPCLVTKDEIPDPHNLRIRTIINGITLQDSNTSDMIFNIPLTGVITVFGIDNTALMFKMNVTIQVQSSGVHGSRLD